MGAGSHYWAHREKQNALFPWKCSKLWYALNHVGPCHEANQDQDGVVHYDYDEVHYYEDYDRFGRRGKQLAKLEKFLNPPPEANLAVGFFVSTRSRKPPATKEHSSCTRSIRNDPPRRVTYVPSNWEQDAPEDLLRRVLAHLPPRSVRLSLEAPRCWEQSACATPQIWCANRRGIPR
jgi:hypothetical protein